LRGPENQTPWPLEENKFIIELRGVLEGIPLLEIDLGLSLQCE